MLSKLVKSSDVHTALFRCIRPHQDTQNPREDLSTQVKEATPQRKLPNSTTESKLDFYKSGKAKVTVSLSF